MGVLNILTVGSGTFTGGTQLNMYGSGNVFSLDEANTKLSVGKNRLLRSANVPHLDNPYGCGFQTGGNGITSHS